MKNTPLNFSFASVNIGQPKSVLTAKGAFQSITTLCQLQWLWRNIINETLTLLTCYIGALEQASRALP